VEYDHYHRNGVVYLAKMSEPDWIELLKSGLIGTCEQLSLSNYS